MSLSFKEQAAIDIAKALAVKLDVVHEPAARYIAEDAWRLASELDAGRVRIEAALKAAALQSHLDGVECHPGHVVCMHGTCGRECFDTKNCAGHSLPEDEDEGPACRCRRCAGEWARRNAR